MSNPIDPISKIERACIKDYPAGVSPTNSGQPLGSIDFTECDPKSPMDPLESVRALIAKTPSTPVTLEDLQPANLNEVRMNETDHVTLDKPELLSMARKKLQK